MSVTVDRVSNARLRKEFLRRREAGWLDENLVALRLGWEMPRKGRVHPDGRRVLRQLGLIIDHSGGKRYWRKMIDRQRAAEMARALNCDPVDLGY